MLATNQPLQHRGSIGAVARLAEFLAIEVDGGVDRQHRNPRIGNDGAKTFAHRPLHGQLARLAALARIFIASAGGILEPRLTQFESKASSRQQLAATGRRRGQIQIERRHSIHGLAADMASKRLSRATAAGQLLRRLPGGANRTSRQAGDRVCLVLTFLPDRFGPMSNGRRP